jgi:hypothetical protein
MFLSRRKAILPVGGAIMPAFSAGMLSALKIGVAAKSRRKDTLAANKPVLSEFKH